MFSFHCVRFLYDMKKKNNKVLFYVNCLRFAILSGLMFLTDFFAMF